MTILKCYFWKDGDYIISMELSVAYIIHKVDPDNGSCRIRRLNMHRGLIRAGIKSKIYTDYYDLEPWIVFSMLIWNETTVAVFDMFSAWELELVKMLKKAEILTVMDHCEGIFGLPLQKEMFETVDIVACCSTKLVELTQQRYKTKCIYLPDPADVPWKNIAGMP